MSVRTRLLFIGAWVISLVLTEILASAQVPFAFLQLNQSTVVAGNDLGFRIDTTKNGVPEGRLVVRVDGHWTDAQIGSSGVVLADGK